MFLAILLLGAQRPQMTLADVQRQLAMIQRQVETGETWTVASGEHVTLSYVPSPTFTEATARSYADAFNDCLMKDCKTLQLDPPVDKLPVYLYPNAEELSKALGMEQTITEGVSLGYWSALIDDGRSLEMGIKSTAARELGLALVHRTLGTYGCGLFSVGVAYYLQASYNKEPWLSKPVPLSATPLRTLSETANSEKEFRQGAAFCAYLVSMDQGDPRRLKQVMTELNRQRLADLGTPGRKPWPDRVEIAFVSTYGKNLDSLEAEWRAAFGKKG